MENAITTMPVKRDGKVLPTGSPLELEEDEFNELLAQGIIKPDTADDAFDENAAEKLKDRLAALIKEGATFEGLNMQKTKAALGEGFDHAKRVEVDAALAAIAQQAND